MKGWVQDHPYLVVALGCLAYLVLVSVGWSVVGQHNLGDAFITGVPSALLYAFIGFVAVRRRTRTRARLDEHGQVKVYLRYPNSPTGSLRSIWNQGIATPSAGLVHFQPAVYESLEPMGRPTTIRVREVVPGRREVHGKDRRYIPGYREPIQAMTLATDEGEVEVAGTPEALDKLSEVVGQV